MFLDLLRPRLPFTLGEKKVGGGKLTKSLLSAWNFKNDRDFHFLMIMIF